MVLARWVGSVRQRDRDVDRVEGRRGGDLGVGSGGHGGDGGGGDSLHGLGHSAASATIAPTLLRNVGAIARFVTHLIAAVPDESLGARMTSDAASFADEVLILGFVERVDDIGYSVGGCLQRFAAETMMTLANNAIDASVAARSGNRAQHQSLGLRIRAD